MLSTPRQRPPEKVRTSITHPIEVAWLWAASLSHPSAPTGRTGFVGITICPGKRGPSTFGARWFRDLESDLSLLRARHEVRHLVTLIEDFEFVKAGLHSPKSFERAARDHGLQVHRFPIPDVSTPSSRQRPALAKLLNDIAIWRAKGESVAIHCMGGLGRSGLVGGCFLRRLGYDAEQVFSKLKTARGPNCPETGAQRAFVHSWPAGLSS